MDDGHSSKRQQETKIAVPQKNVEVVQTHEVKIITGINQLMHSPNKWCCNLDSFEFFSLSLLLFYEHPKGKVSMLIVSLLHRFNAKYAEMPLCCHFIHFCQNAAIQNGIATVTKHTTIMCLLYYNKYCRRLHKSRTTITITVCRLCMDLKIK